MEIVFRAVIVFVFLWLITRAVGRSTLGELSTFELLLYVTMGDLVQQGVTQQDYSMTGAALAVGTFALVTVALSFTQWRFPWTRPALTGATHPPAPGRRAHRAGQAPPARRARRRPGLRTRAGDPPPVRRRVRRPGARRPDLVLHVVRRLTRRSGEAAHGLIGWAEGCVGCRRRLGGAPVELRVPGFTT